MLAIQGRSLSDMHGHFTQIAFPNVMRLTELSIVRLLIERKKWPGQCLHSVSILDFFFRFPFNFFAVIAFQLTALHFQGMRLPAVEYLEKLVGLHLGQLDHVQFLLVMNKITITRSITT